jgi:mannose-1-phosphate guanylyltransferase
MDLVTLRPDRWAIILAGGEGMRLRRLTRRIAGDERPKQFCPLVDGKTLLDRTRDRVALSVRPERTCLVLTRHHEPFYAPLLEGAPPGPLVVQPRDRGTAPAILYGALRRATPSPYGAFRAAWLRRSTLGERETMRSLYASLPAASFSEDVLGTKPANLAVLPVRGVAWSDWGDPGGVLRTLSGLGIHPEWAETEVAPVAAGQAR